MNVIFVSISSFTNVSEHSISLDLLREFQKKNHKVYIICSCDGSKNIKTSLSEEEGFNILRVKIGKNKQAGLIEKGLTQIFLPLNYISAIKKYLRDVKFDVVLYPTPPVTQVPIVKYIKKRYDAKSYLMLKDIFPQNAVDLGMLSKTGIKGLIYKYFRHKEKELYAISDKIGCMSQANVDYISKNNLEISTEKVEVCPNCIEPCHMSMSNEERIAMREKYGIPLDKKVFVYGGNLGKPQGIPFITECLKKCSEMEDVFFLIVGDGTEYGKLEAFVNQENPKNAKLMKRLPKEDYDRMVLSCDVGLIFLDHRFTIPNFPSRLLSYMQAELPVLACTDPNTDIGEVITQGDFGWWCESNSASGFAEAVKKIAITDIAEKGNNGLIFLKNNFTADRGCSLICDNMFEEREQLIYENITN